MNNIIFYSFHQEIMLAIPASNEWKLLANIEQYKS